MNSLSLHAVNASSSYEVSAVNDGCYRLFERWFSTYERKAQYTFAASSLKDDEGIENYAAIIS